MCYMGLGRTGTDRAASLFGLTDTHSQFRIDFSRSAAPVLSRMAVAAAAAARNTLKTGLRVWTGTGPPWTQEDALIEYYREMTETALVFLSANLPSLQPLPLDWIMPSVNHQHRPLEDGCLHYKPERRCCCSPLTWHRWNILAKHCVHKTTLLTGY